MPGACDSGVTVASVTSLGTLHETPPRPHHCHTRSAGVEGRGGRNRTQWGPQAGNVPVQTSLWFL